MSREPNPRIPYLAASYIARNPGHKWRIRKLTRVFWQADSHPRFYIAVYGPDGFRVSSKSLDYLMDMCVQSCEIARVAHAQGRSSWLKSLVR